MVALDCFDEWNEWEKLLYMCEMREDRRSISHAGRLERKEKEVKEKSVLETETVSPRLSDRSALNVRSVRQGPN